jgi:5-methylcytosine-specific restriction protein A
MEKNNNQINMEKIKVGCVYTNDQLMNMFSVANVGGMRKSNVNNCLLLISDYTKGLYENKWIGNELHYTGMGQIGNQSLDFKQNRTLNESNENGIELYLFEVFISNQYIYKGKVKLTGKPYQETQMDSNMKLRKVWMFPLSIIEGDSSITSEQYEKSREHIKKEVKKLSLEELKILAENNSKKEVPKRNVMNSTYIRDEIIAEYTKRRANGICQLCGKEAPFCDENGQPYLESHHIIWLSKGGSDSIENTIALCPNCHKKMHIVDSPLDIMFLQNKNLELR